MKLNCAYSNVNIKIPESVSVYHLGFPSKVTKDQEVTCSLELAC